MAPVVEPTMEGKRDEVVPRRRATDAIATSLRQAFTPMPEIDADLAALLRRLDTTH